MSVYAQNRKKKTGTKDCSRLRLLGQRLTIFLQALTFLIHTCLPTLEVKSKLVAEI